MTWIDGPCLPTQITTVGELRTVLATIPADTVTGPCFVEYSPTDRRADVHPAADPDEASVTRLRVLPGGE